MLISSGFIISYNNEPSRSAWRTKNQHYISNQTAFHLCRSLIAFGLVIVSMKWGFCCFYLCSKDNNDLTFSYSLWLRRVSVLNDRVLIGFNNGSARNSLITELEPRDRNFVERLQNGTVYTTPLASAKEKLSQWSSSVTSTVSKLGKSLKEQYDSLVNNNKNKDPLTNVTTSVTSVSLGPQ